MTSVVGLASGSLPGPGLPPGSAPGPRIATRPRRFGPGRPTAEPGRRTAPSCPGHGRLGPPSDGGRRSRSPHSGPPVDSTSVATTSGRPGPTPTASAPVTPDTPAGRSAAPGRPRPAWSRRSRDTPGIGPGRPSRGARSTRPGRHRLVVRPRRRPPLDRLDLGVLARLGGGIPDYGDAQADQPQRQFGGQVWR